MKAFAIRRHDYSGKDIKQVVDYYQEKKGVIFNIQRYSIHDGPGIRTTIFLKGCQLHCFWCQNPESQKRRPEILFSKELCTLCGRCVSACPTGASFLSEDHSAIDREKCDGCGECVKICPSNARALRGEIWTVGDILKTVMRDKKFYENSGGGITLSGGDPLYQPEFALAILQSCKEAGLHTVIETCGCTSWPTMEKLLHYIDLVFYDIKCIEPAKHKKATGKSNEQILENIKKVAKLKPLRVRVPMIPGFNDTPEDVRAIVKFVKKEIGPLEIDLLPYNNLGESKYERLDRSGITLQPQDDDHMEALKKLVRISPV